MDCCNEGLRKEIHALNIQWFPGHMAKTRRLIQENLKLVDVVIELLDARIPLSSRNPEIDKLVGSKPRIIALNKSDLSDPDKNRLWAQHFKKNNIEVIYTNAITGTGIGQLKNKLKDLTRHKTETAAAKGRMWAARHGGGSPNGESQLINKIAGSKTGTDQGLPDPSSGSE